MAALSADVQIAQQGPVIKHGVKAIGADTFYAGAAVFADATNGKAQVVPEAGDIFIGICAEQKVVSAADEIVNIYVSGLFLIPFATPAEANVGEMIMLDISATQSDNFADWIPQSDTTAAANDIGLGRCVSIDSGGDGWVYVQPGILYVATAGWGG
jgi:hypothetical protein